MLECYYLVLIIVLIYLIYTNCKSEEEGFQNSRKKKKYKDKKIRYVDTPKKIKVNSATPEKVIAKYKYRGSGVANASDVLDYKCSDGSFPKWTPKSGGDYYSYSNGNTIPYYVGAEWEFCRGKVYPKCPVGYSKSNDCRGCFKY